MSLTLLTSRQEQLILFSIRKVFKTGDIDYLTKGAYNFLYLSSGFIAHYNIYGFREEYRDVDYFRRRILDNQPVNQWNNFHPGDRDYDYMIQKKRIYNAICEIVKGE